MMNIYHGNDMVIDFDYFYFSEGYENGFFILSNYYESIIEPKFEIYTFSKTNYVVW